MSEKSAALELWDGFGLKPEIPPSAEMSKTMAGALSAIACIPDLSALGRRWIDTLKESLEIFGTGQEVDPEYIQFVRALFNLYACALMPSKEESEEKQLAELLDKTGILADLYTKRLKPVNPAPAKRIGDYLIDLGFVTQAQLDQAAQEQNEGKHPGLRIGDILQHKGIITRAQLDQAIEAQMMAGFGM